MRQKKTMVLIFKLPDWMYRSCGFSEQEREPKDTLPFELTTLVLEH